MKICYIENKPQIYAKLNSSRKVNIAETRISIVTTMWQFFYYATTEIVCTILTNSPFNCLYVVATCLLLDLVMFTCAYDSFLSIFNLRTAQTKIWGKIVCYELRQWFNVYIRPQEKSTEKINGSRRHKEMQALKRSKNHALRAAHILGSFFFFAFFYKTTWSTQIKCFPLQREHTANYVPVTAYVECSANRKSLTPEQFAIIGNLLTFLLVLQQ